MSTTLAPGRVSQGNTYMSSSAPPMRQSVSPFTPGLPGASGHFGHPPPSAQAPPMSSALSIPHSRFEPPPLASTAGPMPGTLERPIHGPRKRLIITCDGTWLDADNGIKDGKKHPPSNVSRIGWAIKDTSRDGIPQVVSYQAGVGTSGGPVARVIGGATGQGIKENIRQAYTYIATNWRQGDEIFLMGFSRGAFTARSVGGIIGDLGLLTRTGLPYFSEIFDDVEHKNDDRYVSSLPDSPFPNKGRFDNKYLDELVRRGMTRTKIPVKAICCWDTVGRLGIPTTPLIDTMSTRQRRLRDYQFDDTRIHPCVENAFQALALDEHRAPFGPALWEKENNNTTTNLKQVWFPGVHSNIGGGYQDQELSNITLAWMMSRLEPFLDFRPDFLVDQLDMAKKYYKSTDQRPRWWSFGEIYRSLQGVYALTGSKTRTPGNYYRMDAYSGRQTDKRLKNTNEYIHASVRARVGLRGPGSEDKGDYNPRALAEWTFDPEPAHPGTNPGQGGNLSNGTMVVWNYRGDQQYDGQTRIPEAALLPTELALLEQFREVDAYIRQMRPPSGKKRSSKRYEETNGNTNGRQRSSRNESVPPPRRSSAMNGGPPQSPMMAANGPYKEGRRSKYDDGSRDDVAGADDGKRRRHRRRERDRSLDDRDRDRDKDGRRRRESARY